jgi:hypothetical protein
MTIQFSWPAGKSSAIMVAENILSEELCTSIIDESSKYYERLFAPGPVLSGVVANVKNSMDFSWSKDNLVNNCVPPEPLSTYEMEVSNAIFTSVAYYREQFRWLWDWVGICDTGFRMQRYVRGEGFYREHIDGGPVPVVILNRVLGAVIYLNDVEIGGETYFREQDIYVPARAGSIALFPAYWTHPHQGCVPISNDKWIVSTFILENSENQPLDMIDDGKSLGNEHLL